MTINNFPYIRFIIATEVLAAQTTKYKFCKNKLLGFYLFHKIKKYLEFINHISTMRNLYGTNIATMAGSLINYRTKQILYCAGFAAMVLASSCKKNGFDKLSESDEPTAEVAFDINNITDTYANIARAGNSRNWGPYNVHDPSIFKDGEWFYCYSTDVGYGVEVRAGIQIRKSKDLVNWQFVGWVFNGLPPISDSYIKNNGAVSNAGIWAPYVLKAGNEYRLYYSLASTGFRISCIGLATASSPEGPWVEKGIAVGSVTNGPGTNAIDPTVTVTPSGEHYMVYGSAWDGLFEVKLNPATGLASTEKDQGNRIIRRGSTNGVYNGNLEGPEIIYNQDTKMYYLFVAYDWIDTKYNVRVFRSTNPTGPFLDWNGRNADLPEDHGPMILSPYRFMEHGGWAGVSHPSVFQDNGQFFIATQGRPGVDRAFMVLHVRKIFWTPEGWPVVSPERYANVAEEAVTKEQIAGNYEQIVLGYVTVPGYSAEQTDPNYSTASTTVLSADGRINGDANNTWSYTAPWLELRWGGFFVDKLHVSRERDWEKKVPSTIVMSGFNGGGTAIWFKKIQ